MNNKINLENLHLSDDKIKKFKKEIENLFVEREKRMKEFQEHNQDEVAYKIFKKVSEDKVVHEEDILYFQEEYDFNQEEFYLLFESMMNHAVKDDLIFFSNDDFPTSEIFVDYKGKIFTFFEMSGQGTVRSVFLADKLTSEQKKLVFDYPGEIE